MAIEKVTIKSIGEAVKAKSGQHYKSLEFDDRKANMFEDHPLYADLKEGAEIELDLEKNGKWLNIKKPGKKGNSGFQKIKREERKADIREAQDRKEQSIAYFNSLNTAIECARLKITNGHKYDNDFEIQRDIETWRNHWMTEWETYKIEGKATGQVPFE